MSEIADSRMALLRPIRSVLLSPERGLVWCLEYRKLIERSETYPSFALRRQ